MPKKTYKKRPDGRYAVYRDGKAFYGSTIAEAEDKRRLYDLEKAQGLDHEKAGMRISEYAEKWLPVHRFSSCAKSYKLYAKILDKFIEFTRDAKVKDVRKTDIVAFYNTLAGYSQTHIDKHVATIRGLFQSAKEDGIILRDPTKDATAPTGTEGKYAHRPLEDWERDLVHRMVDVEYKVGGEVRHGHPFALAAMVMLYQGLRLEEALALDIDRDIDFDNNRLHVREAFTYTETHRGQLGAPKTETSIRSMPLFAPIRDLLKDRHGKLVTAIKAEQVTNSSFASMWKSYKTQMAVLHNGTTKRWAQGSFTPINIRTHDFRHSFCTLICEAGVDIKVAMMWLGHSDEKMIRQVYEHVTQKRLQIAEQNTAKMIDKLLPNSQNNSQNKIDSPEVIEI